MLLWLASMARNIGVCLAEFFRSMFAPASSSNSAMSWNTCDEWRTPVTGFCCVLYMSALADIEAPLHEHTAQHTKATLHERTDLQRTPTTWAHRSTSKPHYMRAQIHNYNTPRRYSRRSRACRRREAARWGCSSRGDSRTPCRSWRRRAFARSSPSRSHAPRARRSDWTTQTANVTSWQL